MGILSSASAWVGVNFRTNYSDGYMATLSLKNKVAEQEPKPYFVRTPKQAKKLRKKRARYRANKKARKLAEKQKTPNDGSNGVICKNPVDHENQPE
jgi:predicted transcriptional regulator of viral defense system